jgi:hypothetical protein
MKMRQRIFAVNWSYARRIHIAKSLLMRHRKLLYAAAAVNGLGFRAWIRDGHPRYQVLHYDNASPAALFYRAIGTPLPPKFATRFVTVGGLTRLIGYLKLHISQEQRDIAEEEILESEVEDDDG